MAPVMLIPRQHIIIDGQHAYSCCNVTVVDDRLALQQLTGGQPATEAFAMYKVLAELGPTTYTVEGPTGTPQRMDLLRPG
jgi:hypothetical protein